MSLVFQVIQCAKAASPLSPVWLNHVQKVFHLSLVQRSTLVLFLIAQNCFMQACTGLIVYDTGRWDPMSVASSKKKRKLQEDSDSDEDEHEGVRLCESCDQLMDR